MSALPGTISPKMACAGNKPFPWMGARPGIPTGLWNLPGQINAQGKKNGRERDPPHFEHRLSSCQFSNNWLFTINSILVKLNSIRGPIWFEIPRCARNDMKVDSEE